MDVRKALQECAQDCGFEALGIARAHHHPHYFYFLDWLERKSHAGMNWLARNPERRHHPESLLPGVQSVIVVLKNYALEEREVHPGEPYIAQYARYKDYHQSLEQALQPMVECLLKFDPESKHKICVDSSALLERSWAYSAGLGWIGKNTCLIHPKIGSLVFLAEILTTSPLPADSPQTDHCGTCTRCIDACPTQALSPYQLDSNLCIAYQTIEHRGPRSEQSPSTAGHFFGCDICQTVCPWNQKTPRNSDSVLEHDKRWDRIGTEDLREAIENYEEMFIQSPMRRAKKEGLMRNLNALDSGFSKTHPAKENQDED